MFSYHYYSGADGRHYCYSSQKTERCPLVEHSTDGLRLTPRGEVVADAIGQHADGRTLILRAHRGISHERPKDGKCACCGVKLDLIGYGVWIEAPWDQIPQDDDNARATRAINERLGSTHGRVPGSFRHFLLKREAMQWCREEADIDRASKREELAAEG